MYRLLGLWAWLSAATIAWAASPYAISYSGRLTGEGGAPLAGTLDLEVRFYDAVSGGNQIGPVVSWSGVTFAEGVFQRTLTLSPAEFDAVFGGAEAPFVEIKEVASGRMYPRQTFSAVPYALRVPVDGDTLTYDATTGKLKVKAIPATVPVTGLLEKPLDLDLSNNAKDGWIIAWDKTNQKFHLQPDVQGGGLTPDVVTSTHIANDEIVNADINANAAIAPSKIAGGTNVSAAEFGYLDTVSSNVQTQLDAHTTAIAGKAPTAHAHSSLDGAGGGPANALIVDNAGNVGIGTTTPATTVDVRGTGTTLSGTAFYTLLARDSPIGRGVSLGFDTADNAGVIAPIGSSSKLAIWTHDGSSWGERMRVASSGNVGIGSTSPTSKLDVTGTVTATGLKLSTSPTSGHVLTSDGAGNGTWQAPAAATWASPGAIGATTPSTGAFMGVSIGTTAAGTDLYFGSGAGRTISVAPNVAAGNGLTVQAGGTSAGSGNVDGGDLTLSSGAAFGTGTSSLHFKTADGGAPVESMTILGNGNVGIGTTSAAAKTEIKFDSATTPGLRISSPSLTTGSPSLELFNGGNFAYAWRANDADSTLRLSNSSASFPGTDLMAIDLSGKVGIGTTSPTSALEVASNSSTGGIIARRAETATNPAYLTLFRTRNTLSSPQTLTADDGIGEVRFSTIDTGSTERKVAAIAAEAEGAAGTSSIATRLVFRTTPDGTSGGTSERMRINAAGNVGIGSNNPQSKLDVNGAADFGGDGAVNLYLAAVSGTNEGAQINFAGSTGYDHWVNDVYQQKFRIANDSVTNGTVEIANFGAGVTGLTVEGEVKVGTGSTACAAGVAGLIRYNSSTNRPEACVSQNAGATWEWLAMAQNILTANRTYYVRTDGNDSNTGLTNSSGGAFLTIQRAIDAVTLLDLSNYDVTIQIADGTYDGAVVASREWRGRGNVTLLGNTTTPANVVVKNTSGSAIQALDGARLTISGMELQSTGGHGIVAATQGVITIGEGIRFGTCTFYQISAHSYGEVFGYVPYSIVGGASSHMVADRHGTIQVISVTVTLTGTPAFTYFAYATISGVLSTNGITYSGSATGTRYSISLNAVAYTNGGGANYFPGSIAGSTATGGQYY